MSNLQMDQLSDLIYQYGPPDALIDNYSLEYGYAIWGFDNSYSIGHNSNQDNVFDELQIFLDQCLSTHLDIKAVGFLSYDVKDLFYKHLDFKKTLDSSVPILWFGKPKKIMRYAVDSKCISPDDKFLVLNSDIKELIEYKKIIEKIKEQLQLGNTYQINFTMEKIFKTDQSPIDIYLSIREYAKPAFGYFLNTGSHYILSFSPEEFFHTKNNQIFTYPMKGTIRRGNNQRSDQLLKQKLKNSEKDRAEHIMIVDLLRNDLGKICKYGSISATELFNIKSYPTVHQMVSCIQGQLREDIKYIDIFKALCPGGSITGAPKESSMRIIDSLEDYNRGIYTGNIGYIDSNGDLHFNIAIRTMMIMDNIVKYCVGGGIVWDSDAENEWHEAQLKSKILDYFIKEQY